MSLGIVLDSARELTAGASNVATRLIDSSPLDAAEIHKLLASQSDRDRSSGLKAILRLMSQGQDATGFYTDVVRSCHSRNSLVRDMVAAYLETYSISEPELTLMAINGIQKLLGESSAITRANSLRLLSSLQVPAVAPIIFAAIKELSGDPSPLVRIAVCKAIAKIHYLDPSLSPDVLEVLQSKLAERKDPRVVGAALSTLLTEFPSRMELIHPVFRYAARNLTSFESWSQVDSLRLLTRYCRHYMAGTDDPDLVPLTESCRELLLDLNDAVVIEAAAAICYLGSAEIFEEYGVAQKVCNLSLSEISLPSIIAIAKMHPSLFLPYRRKFLDVSPSDRPQVRTLKLRAFMTIRSGSSEAKGLTASEFADLKFLATSFDDTDTVHAALQALTLAGSGHKSCRKTVRWLVSLIADDSTAPVLTGEALLALRILIQQLPFSQDENMQFRSWTLSKLALHATASDRQVITQARATLIWLIGEYSGEQPDLAAEVLRKLLLSLPTEPDEVRLQIMQLAAKLSLASDKYDEMIQYTLHLGFYDLNYDTRDRSRYFSALSEEKNMAALMLQSVKPPSLAPDVPDLLIGSASLVVGHSLDGSMPLEGWVGNSNSSLRDEHTESTLVSGQPSVLSMQSFSSGSGTQPGPSSASQSLPTKNIKRMTLEEFLESESASTSGAESGDEEEDEDDDADEEQENEDSNKQNSENSQ